MSLTKFYGIKFNQSDLYNKQIILSNILLILIIQPGGPSLILKRGGSDATTAFVNVGHSNEALNKLK